MSAGWNTFWQVTGSYLHLLAVAAYLGGTIVMEFVLPAAMKAVPPAQAQVVGEKTADRFLIMVWVALALFPASGMMLFIAQQDQSLFSSGQIFSTGSGRTLFAMMALWAVLVANGIVVTFVLRPRLKAKVAPGASSIQATGHVGSMAQAAKWISRIARTDLVIALFVVLLGASLAYGNGIL